MGSCWPNCGRHDGKNANGHTFLFREDGYINMTKAAKAFGKKLDNFWRNEGTSEYIEALKEGLHTHSYSREFNDGFIQTFQGRNGGTWCHPKLAIFFARWLDVRFAVWCDLMSRGSYKSLPSF
ncbi:KilA-N domain-containing protein [Rhodocyclus tenuis]|uniref:KilA-N domain-containing protein n=1 Tax=Rhodocyclus tenuis TaxID=1066 RepID=UPI001A92F079|nr:KilA-N domain-containing protein [Rhodocyclus tenuis]MBK1679753.1 hypothetical protein [Rhodocyclus tenuis]